MPRRRSCEESIFCRQPIEYSVSWLDPRSDRVKVLLLCAEHATRLSRRAAQKRHEYSNFRSIKL